MKQATRPKPIKTEADARAALSAGRAVPLEWLWVLGDAALTVTNAGQPGRTLELAAGEHGPGPELPQVAH